MKDKIIRIVLVLAGLGVLGYCIYESIMQPIRFQKLADWRYQRTKQSLINIRDAQVAFKSTYGKYTNNFDTLQAFVKEGNEAFGRLFCRRRGFQPRRFLG